MMPEMGVQMALDPSLLAARLTELYTTTTRWAQGTKHTCTGHGGLTISIVDYLGA